MSKLLLLIKRNTKLFFKDKGAFIPSLITPIILLVLYATFLAKVYKDSFLQNLPNGMNLADGIIDGLVGCQLLSSLLAVSCVTIAFCSNMIMVSDKVTGARKDLTISPVKGSTMALGYYISSLFSTLIICFVALGVGLIYVKNVGWYLSGTDVALIVLDVFLLTMFGTALSSVINFFLSTQGQISAVGTIISSGYGFICGAYMPIGSFADGLQKVLSFLPGTYGTSLIRNHCMRGVIAAAGKEGIPEEHLDGIRASLDCSIEFFGHEVSEGAMYAILAGSVAVLLGVYIFLNVLASKKAKK